LIKNCDEFIFYDDLVRADEQRRKASRKADERGAEKAEGKRRKNDARKQHHDGEPQAGEAAAPAGGDARQQALELVAEPLEALVNERGGDDRIYASMVKQALKRRRPDFNEAAYGYKLFGKLLEAAQAL